MLDFNAIHARVKWAMNCTDDEAWSGINQAYLGLDTSFDEAQQAKWLKVSACGWILTWRTNPSLVTKAADERHRREQSIAQNADRDGGIDTDDDIFVAPAPQREDKELIAELVKLAPKEYRLSLTIVVLKLLHHAPTKPVSQETVRKILQAAKIPNTSDQAAHVYTFLSTIRRIF